VRAVAAAVRRVGQRVVGARRQGHGSSTGSLLPLVSCLANYKRRSISCLHAIYLSIGFYYCCYLVF
jgi:hypothetical protein